MSKSKSPKPAKPANCCQPKSAATSPPKSAKVGLCPCWTCTSPTCTCDPCTCFTK